MVFGKSLSLCMCMTDVYHAHTVCCARFKQEIEESIMSMMKKLEEFVTL